MSAEPPSQPRRDSHLPLGVSSVRVGPVMTIILHRPQVKNCVDGPTARALYDAFIQADADPHTSAIVLYGAGGTFCAGADLTALSQTQASAIAGTDNRTNPIQPVQPLRPDEDPHSIKVQSHITDIGPMGISRLILSKPAIAAIAGHAVAGGLELACFCDLRVGEVNSIYGVFCRRFGVPLIDGGTVRLPRLIGQSRAMDMILTGRAVEAREAFEFGLVNRIVPVGEVREAAEALALSISQFPQRCLRSDRWSAIHQHSKPLRLALEHEFADAVGILQEEGVHGAASFSKGHGRHGKFNKVAPSTPTAINDSESQLTPNILSASSRSSAASPSLVAGQSTSSPVSLAHLPHRPHVYRCVLFDLGGVVVESPVHAILEYERELGLPRNGLNMLLGSSKHFHALERGELDLAQFAPLVEAEANQRGFKVDAIKLFDLMAQVQIRQEMLDAIQKLRSRGFVVGAVTNNWKNVHTDTRGVLISQLDPHFHFIIESCLVGTRKPEPRIFDLAFEKCDWQLFVIEPHWIFDPNQCIFLDDLGINLKSAQTCGMKTIKVTKEYHTAIRELQALTGVSLLEEKTTTTLPSKL